jgi:hypothetical protein
LHQQNALKAESYLLRCYTLSFTGIPVPSLVKMQPSFFLIKNGSQMYRHETAAKLDGREISIPDGTDFNSIAVNGTASASHEISEEQEILSLLDTIKIKADEVLHPPPAIMAMIQGDDEIPILLMGDFSLVKGKAKSRKSFFVSMLLTSFITGRKPSFSKFTANEFEGKKRAIYFDTEQQRYHVLKALRRIEKISGLDPTLKIDFYPLRQYRPAERMKMIETAIQNTPDLGLVVIDGIRDIVTSINDEDQACETATKLMQWSQIYNIHIVTVLHENKGDGNARGHLGTELTNKAAALFSVVKDSESREISTVAIDGARGTIEPDPFAFYVDDLGLPCIADEWTPTKRGGKKQDALSLDEFESILTEAFSSKGSKLMYSEMVEQLKAAFKAIRGESIGTNAIKKIITDLKSQGWLIQQVDKGPYELRIGGTDSNDTPDGESSDIEKEMSKIDTGSYANKADKNQKAKSNDSGDSLSV